MTHGDEAAADTASGRLRHLHDYFLEHPVTGPVEGHTPTRTAAAPLSLGTLSHIRASVAEVVQHTHETNPDAGPAPTRADAVYDWARQHTEHADDTDRIHGEIIEYRQYLEHAVRAGDIKVVRRHPCPLCGTWGLMWVREHQRALCTNTDCTDRDGLSRMFPLHRLAFEHVIGRKNLRHVSAT